MRLELTRRGDYAVRAAIALARANGQGLRSTRRIAADMSIPPRFLPQVMADMARAGIVVGQTGRTGGYRLARPPEKITLLDVIRAAERENGMRLCVLRGGPCNPDGRCDVHDVFVGARDSMLDTLAQATLASIVEAHPEADPVEASTARSDPEAAGAPAGVVAPRASLRHRTGHSARARRPAAP